MVSKIALIACATAACVQAGPVAAQTQASYEFNLPAQSLATSLRAVATQTGSNIVFVDAVVHDKNAPALRGSHTAAEAYRMLLRGTGLTLAATDGGSFMVTESAPPPGGGQVPQAGARDDRRAGTIAGRITAAKDGRNISGALVSIEGTDQTATADDIGNYYLPNVRPGSYTLRVSYLGYQTVAETVDVAPGQQTSADFSMREPLEERAGDIVVFGQRSADATSLNLQRAASNDSTVISADDMGNFTGTTFSDALRRAPGVAFLRDGVTGDGTNVVVRGLEPDMNAVKLNGLNLPVTNGTSRSADLSNLLADSVSKITISKSLLPSQDSSGTGGLIEIETKSPLDRPHRYGRFLIEGGASERDFSHDMLVSGTVAGSFGADRNFGVSASVQYRRNAVRNIAYGVNLGFGAFLPLGPDGTPLVQYDQIEPTIPFPYAEGDDEAYVQGLQTSFNHTRQETWSWTGSAEWQVAAETNLKFDYFHSETTRTDFSASDNFSGGADYTVLPGDPRAALHVNLEPGNFGFSRAQGYGYNPDSKNVTDNYSFRGKTNIGTSLELNYLAGYAHGWSLSARDTGLSFNTPSASFVPGNFLPEAVDPELGYIITPFAPRSGDGIPIPLFTDATWAAINDPSAFGINSGSGQIDRRTGLNDRYTGEASARWNANAAFLKYIQVGGYFEKTKFKNAVTRSQYAGTATAAEMGLGFGPSNLSRIGVNVPGFTLMPEGVATHFLKNINQYAADYPSFQIVPIVPHPDEHNQQTIEKNFAAYFESSLQFGKLEIVGGVRYNRTDLVARNLIYPRYIGPLLPERGGGFGEDLIFQNEFSELKTESAHSSDFLPRVLFNYRENENLIFRGGYYLSVARPKVMELSTITRISFLNMPIPGPQGVKPILQLSTGNPDLKQASTHNFDISAEYYKGVGVIKVAAFYKKIDNLLQTNEENGPANLEKIVLPDSPYFQGPPYFDPAHPENYFINAGSPINSPHGASLWGFETQIQRQLTFLPGAFNGLGIYANYTFTKSSRVVPYTWANSESGNERYEFSGVPFKFQPKHSGTIAMTYNKYGIDSSLTYSFQSRTLENFIPHNLSVYKEGPSSLDFKIQYYWRPNYATMRFFFEGSDLLKGTGDPDVQMTRGGEGGVTKWYSNATYLGGRRIKFGVSVNF